MSQVIERTSGTVAGSATAQHVYFISDRPEAYEVWGEISLSQAREFARLIAGKAAAQFPGVEFRVDGGWHQHEPGMEHIAAVIEEHWESWVDEWVRTKHA